MPRRGEPLRKLGFLTIGRFDDANPGPGIEETLQVIERAEALGFDSVWLRDRHLQPGISSPVAIMAAASQRTSRIELGTAVIPLGLENPFRLAEDLATVDVMSGGRVNPGVSVGTPMMYDHYKTALYPDTHDLEDFSKERVLRLLRALRGEPVSDFEGVVGIERFTRRIQPHSPGLADRVWYGGGLESAKWAGAQGVIPLAATQRAVAGLELSRAAHGLEVQRGVVFRRIGRARHGQHQVRIADGTDRAVRRVGLVRSDDAGVGNVALAPVATGILRLVIDAPMHAGAVQR